MDQTYGIWVHVHRHANGEGEESKNWWWASQEDNYSFPYRTKKIAGRVMRDLALVSTSHHEYTVQAYPPDGGDGCNAICIYCKGPTRRVSDMMTSAEVWNP